MARNEVLALNLYKEVGIAVPDVIVISPCPSNLGGNFCIASEIVEGLEHNKTKLINGNIKGIYEGFMMDAWLANWDVVGFVFDNMLIKNGLAYRIDVGGAIRYRAKGDLKNEYFSDTVPEIDRMRKGTYTDKQGKKHPEPAAAVFGAMTDKDLELSARKVISFTDKKIDELLSEFGPKDGQDRKSLSDKLKKRRDYIKIRFPANYANDIKKLEKAMNK